MRPGRGGGAGAAGRASGGGGGGGGGGSGSGRVAQPESSARTRAPSATRTRRGESRSTRFWTGSGLRSVVGTSNPAASSLDFSGLSEGRLRAPPRPAKGGPESGLVPDLGAGDRSSYDVLHLTTADPEQCQVLRRRFEMERQTTREARLAERIEQAIDRSSRNVEEIQRAIADLPLEATACVGSTTAYTRSRPTCSAHSTRRLRTEGVSIVARAVHRAARARRPGGAPFPARDWSASSTPGGE